MFEYGNSIYTSFNPNFKNFPVENRIRSLVMGHCGVGKTHFINNACNTRHDAKNARGSLTRDIVYEDVTYFPPGKFRIYDTPGSNSNENAYEHALIIRASLTKLPLNLIMVQTKFHERIDPAIDQLSAQIKIFKGYESMVVFLVSFIDKLKPHQKQNSINLFGQALQQLKIKAKVILYSNTTSDFGDLTHLLYNIGCQNKFTLVKIDDNTFYKYFHLSKSITAKHSEEIQEHVQQIQQLSDLIIEFAKSIDRNSEQNDILFSQLKLYMKSTLKELQNEQYKKYSGELDNRASVTDQYLMISQYIVSRLEELDNISNMKTQKKFYEDQYEKQFDARDLFKKCPYCNLMWMKVRGCNNITCGNKPGVFDYIENKIFLKYEFSFSNGKLSYKKNQIRKIEQQDIQIIEQKNLTRQSQLLGCKINNGKVGCGQNFDWDLQPRLPNIDEVLKQFYRISNPEQIKLELQKINKDQQNFAKLIQDRVNYNLKIMQKDRL